MNGDISAQLFAVKRTTTMLLSTRQLVLNVLTDVTGALSRVTESCFRGEVLVFWGRWVFSRILLAASCSCSLLKEDTTLDSALKMDEAWSMKRALSWLKQENTG